MTMHATFELRPGAERGRTNFGWLQSRHSFSFGRFQDPARMSFRSLRVLNDDVVAPSGGFGKHGHDNMEIVSWVLDGTLAHRDSTGEGGVLRPGDLQVMTAGRGIQHSEMNGSDSDPVHFLQIWIEPAERDLEPTYSQRSFPADGRRGRWQLLASPDARESSMQVHQDVSLRVAELEAGDELDVGVPPDRHGYLHVVTGVVRIDDATLEAGDAISFGGDVPMTLKAAAVTQVLFFDLA